MARTALIIKANRRHERAAKAIESGKKEKFSTKRHNRCKECGKIGGYMRKFAICRICFKELANQGKIMGVKKSSW